MEREPILIAEDDENMRRVLAAMVEREGYRPVEAANGLEALRLLRENPPAVVVTDLKMPEMDGLELLEHVESEAPDVPVIMITAHGTIESAVEALKKGAFDYLTKPFDDEELASVLGKAVRTSGLARKEARKPSEPADARRIIGDDSRIREIFKLIDKVAPSPSTVLITGETGTGKELIAREIHARSPRRDQPFIKINCAAIPENLMESELFGYERGAFTGAVSNKPGRFELAHEGTLFLDEIGTLSQDMQAKLLQVMQEGMFERVGGIKTVRVDVRLIAATNLDIQREVSEGRFREDLFYRINVVPIRIPPLRERRGDVPLLVDYFLKGYGSRVGRPVEGVSEEALDLLIRYRWPGNIRELENVIERAVLLCEGPRVVAGDLPAEIRLEAGDSGEEAPGPEGVSLKSAAKSAARAVERDMILKALKETGGNVTRAAKRLGVSRKGLQLKMKELGIRGRESDLS